MMPLNTVNNIKYRTEQYMNDSNTHSHP